MKKIASIIIAIVMACALAPAVAIADEAPAVDPAAPVEPTEPQGPVFFEGFNHAAAVEYSERYVFNYNPSYFDCNPIGGDCANFVSQCLYAGGIPQTVSESGNWKEDGVWYSATDVKEKWETKYTAASWINCVWMHKYFSQHGNVFICNNTAKGRAKIQDQVWPGCIVLYSRVSNKPEIEWGHATLCVGYDADGEPIINCHNSSRYHSKWSCFSKGRHPKICVIQLTQSAPTSKVIREGSTMWKQKLDVTNVTKTYKAKMLAKGAKSFSTCAYALGDAKITYAKYSGSSKLKVSSTGAVTVKKGTKAGKYSATITATAAKSAIYKKGSAKYKVTVTVK